MSSSGIFGLALVAVFGIATVSGNLLDTLYCNNKVIGGDLPSLPCIVNRMCGAKNDAATITDFYACYDNVPNQEIFFSCQDKVFGGQLNATPKINEVCELLNLYKVGPYGICLKKTFDATAGANMDASVTQVNICQGKVLKLKTIDG